MQAKITNRIVAQTGVPQLFSTLAEAVSPADLQSLLLAVYQKRVGNVRPARVFEQTRRSALFAPSDVDARLLNTFDRVAFASASGFDAVELAPVCALGATFALGGIDQNNILTVIRNAEVAGDSTVAMALECARRRRVLPRAPSAPVRLCGSHRVVRLQPFDRPGFSPHFRLFGLVSAGRDRGSYSFETESLGEHIRFYLDLFRALNAEGFALNGPVVEISDVSITEILLASAGVTRDEVRECVRAHRPEQSERLLRERNIALPAGIADPEVELKELAHQHRFEAQFSRLVFIRERIVDVLRASYPEAQFRFNLARLEGLGYYPGLCLRISPAAPDGVRYGIVDGGFTDWTARLLEDRKERLLTSGIGSEFVCRKYLAPADQ